MKNSPWIDIIKYIVTDCVPFVPLCACVNSRSMVPNLFFSVTSGVFLLYASVLDDL